jgi:hypothetical protein
MLQPDLRAAIVPCLISVDLRLSAADIWFRFSQWPEESVVGDR